MNGVNVEEKKNEEKDPQVIIGACRISQELAVVDKLLEGVEQNG